MPRSRRRSSGPAGGLGEAIRGRALALGIVAWGGTASAQATSAFPPAESDAPPDRDAPPPSTEWAPEAPPPGTAPPASSRPPPTAAGQTLGPYRRPPGATMPGYGEAERPAYIVQARRSEYFHDGFYLRLAGGFGIASDAQSTDVPLPTTRDLRFRTGPYSGNASSFAPGTEVAIGFTPVGGLVVAFAVDTATLPGATATVDDPRTGDYEFRTSQFALFSAMGDFYFDRELGFHAQAGLGLATYVSGVGDPVIDGPRAQAHTAVGFGFMLGAGYEWFVSRQWSLGLLARVLWGSTSGTDPRGVDWSHTTMVPGLLLGGTYH
jgi:hypothetical protein